MQTNDIVSDPNTLADEERTPFENYVRMTFKKVSTKPSAHYSLVSPHTRDNVINLPPNVEAAFGWKILSMKPIKPVPLSTKADGTITFAEAVGGDLRSIFASNGLSPYFVVKTNSHYVKFSRNRRWVFDPTAASYSIIYSMADALVMPNITSFQNSVSNHLTTVLLSI